MPAAPAPVDFREQVVMFVGSLWERKRSVGIVFSKKWDYMTYTLAVDRCQAFPAVAL